MYTDTARPNHLAQEVIDNAVDEAIAGFAKRINVIYHIDGSLEVSDDGRGCVGARLVLKRHDNFRARRQGDPLPVPDFAADDLHQGIVRFLLRLRRRFRLIVTGCQQYGE